MRIGKLRDRIAVQRQGVVTRDSLGGEIISWTTFAEPWAEIEPWHLKSRLSQRRLAGESVNGFRVRVLDVAIGNRIIHGSESYIIDDIDATRKNYGELLLIACAEATEPEDAA